jgi:hypothetical protein
MAAFIPAGLAYGFTDKQLIDYNASVIVIPDDVAVSGCSASLLRDFLTRVHAQILTARVSRYSAAARRHSFAPE